MANHYVYILFRDNGQPFYIGKGEGRRWLVHEYKARLGTDPNRHKSRIIRRMFRMGWTEIPKVKIAEHLTHDQACLYEVAWIAALGRYPNGPLVNLTDGGEGTLGRSFSAETIAKIAAGHLGKTPSAETLFRLRTMWFGKKHSAETRAKMSATATGRKRKPFSAEWRAKMGDARRGRKHSPEARAKIAAGNRKPKPRNRIIDPAAVEVAAAPRD